MNTILKSLIATACICVIAVSAHYGYVAYRESVAEQQALERAKERARQTVEDAKRRAEQENAKRSERLRARAEEREQRREEKRIARERIERQKQADRDKAAAVLRDAVVD